MSCAVYWIHLGDHTDPRNEGYIGVSIDPKQRLIQHHSAANLKRHVNPHLQYALLKYKETIKVDVLLKASEDYCYEIERLLRPSPKIGWNLLQGGEGGFKAGYEESLETRKKKSLAHTGKKRSPEQCRLMSLGQTGLIRKGQGKGVLKSEEHKAALRKPKSDTSKMGKFPRTEEYRKKLSGSISLHQIFYCPHCGKTGKGAGNAKRWHFDKCKELSNGQQR